ncbi:uncharacterized protein [Drosophila pseudoobscura]|uniref:Uncharacterized protein n=1 Tax=Drosophila pseudoobscura pseudoobscura TaxID=46245 RepID=A0A6I8VPE3_DROPS|nr:uncharacterized protein LOC117183346 [Drosophila pseudoobscura]
MHTYAHECVSCADFLACPGAPASLLGLCKIGNFLVHLFLHVSQSEDSGPNRIEDFLLPDAGGWMLILMDIKRQNLNQPTNGGKGMKQKLKLRRRLWTESKEYVMSTFGKTRKGFSPRDSTPPKDKSRMKMGGCGDGCGIFSSLL